MAKKKSERKEMELHIRNAKIGIEVNDEVYDDYDFKEIRKIVNHMSKDIWIDKTYVNYKGNKFSDSFIVEKKWYELLDLIRETNYGKNAAESEKEEIKQSIMAIVMTYLYQILEKYNYEVENIDLSFFTDSFSVKYLESNRKNWDS